MSHAGLQLLAARQVQVLQEGQGLRQLADMPVLQRQHGQVASCHGCAAKAADTTVFVSKPFLLLMLVVVAVGYHKLCALHEQQIQQELTPKNAGWTTKQHSARPYASQSAAHAGCCCNNAAAAAT
jgi:hypothetical protein